MTNKKETSGVFGGKKWTAGRRRPRRHRFVCVRNFQVIQICDQQSGHHNITWHHVTLSQVMPQHHSTWLPLFHRFAEFPKDFCLFKFHLRKSPTKCVLRDGHETLTLHFWTYPLSLNQLGALVLSTQAMLGIYWRLLSMQRDVGSAHQGFADQLLQLIEMNPAIWRNMVFDFLMCTTEMNSQFF